MNKSIRLFTAALSLAAASLVGMSAAQAQTVITSLPYTITATGTYVLNSNLSSTQTSGVLITINASNVTLNFQGHYISGPAGNTSQSSDGIYAYEHSNLTIKNGTVAYCSTGIFIGGTITNAVDQQIENMRVTHCYYTGIDIERVPSSRITNCQISQIGFSTATGANGININGTGVTVEGCSISNILAVSNAVTHYIYSDTGSFVRHNQISSALYGVQYGIY